MLGEAGIAHTSTNLTTGDYCWKWRHGIERELPCLLVRKRAGKMLPSQWFQIQTVYGQKYYIKLNDKRPNQNDLVLTSGHVLYIQETCQGCWKKGSFGVRYKKWWTGRRSSWPLTFIVNCSTSLRVRQTTRTDVWEWVLAGTQPRRRSRLDNRALVDQPLESLFENG